MVTSLGAGRTMKLDGTGGHHYPSWAARMVDVFAGQDKSRAHLPVIIVVSGFYIKEDAEGVRAIMRWIYDRCEGGLRPLVAVTVSAEWCCSLPEVQEFAQAADFLFANEPEVKALAEALHLRGVAQDIQECPITAVARWKGTGWIIATRGAQSVGALKASTAVSGIKPMWVPVPRLPADEFADDVGAGDSFMGGFLASVWRSIALRSGAGEQRQAAWWMPKAFLCCANRESVPKTWEEKAFAEDPAGTLLEAADVEDACRAGVATASDCCRSVGCTFAP